MFVRIRRRLTFANVCSSLALMIALGTGTAYAANTVYSTDIVDGQVKTVDLGANAVKTAKIGDDAVTGSKVLDGSLTSGDLAADSVGSSQIAAGSVGTSEIATDGVGASEISDNSIDGGEIIDNSLTATDLATGSVGTAEVATNSLTTADLLGADVNGSAISFSSGAVANGRCKDFDVTIGGAHAGEAVVFSLKTAPPEGMLFYGVNVPADNHVTLKVCNLTGGTSPAMSNIPVRVITFG